MREYEVVFVIKGTEPDDAIEALTGQMQEVAKQQGAEIVNVDKWGRRKLAYDIANQREGYYVLFHLKSERAAIAELERKFKMNDTIIRFLTVRLDNEIRRARRRAELRAKKKGLDPAAELPKPTSRPREIEEEEARPEAEPEEEEGEA